jgi:type IV pilus assembly protein PilO
MALGLNKLPWYGAMIVTGLLGAAGAGTYHYLYAGFPSAVAGLLPVGDGAGTLRGELVKLEAELARERQEIQKGLEAERRLVEFREELKDLERQFNDLKVVLPDKRDVADMLRRIQTLATQSSLVVKLFRPSAVVSKQVHQEWPMSLELEGNYHDLARFFDQVSKVPRIINVGGIAITGAKSETPTDLMTISAKCTATTFVLLNEPAPADDKGKKGGKARPGRARPGAAAAPKAAR